MAASLFCGLTGVRRCSLEKIRRCRLHWFESLRDIVPNHYLSTPHDRTLEVEALTPVKVEVVIRGYLAGSIMRAYQTGERLFCGVRLPEGLKPYEKLTAPIITPTTKAAAFEHDENTSAEDLIQNNVCTRSEWDQICTLANKVFQHGQTTFGKMGWILADTKYEFGKDKNGKIKLMDEVHTPDSSRLWSNLNYAENLKNGRPPEMLDKENIRRFLMEKGFSGYGDVPTTPKAEFVNLAKVYLRVLESLTGKPLVFDEVSAQSVSVIQ